MPIQIIKPIRPLPASRRRALVGNRLQRTRMRLFVDNDFTCAKCHLVFPPHCLELDHKLPLDHGGSDDDSNLQVMCIQCHREKTNAWGAVQKDL